MSCPINAESLAQLKSFTTLCQTRPELLHLPDLAFFKDFIEFFGGRVPEPTTNRPKMDPKPKPEETTMSDEELPDLEEQSDPESDLELDMDGCVEPDKLDDNQKMGDPDKEPTEEEMDQADEIKREALSELGNGNSDKAIELFTNAIETNPKLAILYTKRGQAYLKLNRPNACIKDCTHALELNPDSAAGYKFRGRAYRLIGKWEEAAKDLRQACKIDFDEQSDEWLKEAQPFALKIENHRVKQERKKLDKEEREKKERLRKAKEAHAKASAEQKQGAEPRPRPEGGMGGMPSSMDDFMKLMQDPEIMEAFQDPEVAAAFQDISTNPGNIVKYQSNPKVQALLTKLTSKIGASGGFPGMPGMGGMGGMPDFPGMGGMGGMGGVGFPPQDDGLD